MSETTLVDAQKELIDALQAESEAKDKLITALERLIDIKDQIIAAMNEQQSVHEISMVTDDRNSL